jgi:hypothetical protein
VSVLLLCLFRRRVCPLSLSLTCLTLNHLRWFQVIDSYIVTTTTCDRLLTGTYLYSLTNILLSLTKDTNLWILPQWTW